MKTSGFVWGAIFLLVGVLLLVENFGIATIDWVLIMRLWPLILIFMGIGMVFKGNWLGQFLTIIIVLASLVGIGMFAIFGGPKDVKDFETSTQNLSVDMARNIQSGKLLIQSGASEIKTGEVSKDLITANTVSNFGQYVLDKNIADGVASIKLSLEKNVRWWNAINHHKNNLTLGLNETIPWDIDFQAGASNIDLDLSTYKIKNLALSIGASNIKIKLGDKQSANTTIIKSGASKIEIAVPKEIGCQVQMTSGFSGKTLADFVKIDDNLYQSPDYSTIAKKIDIQVESGASSIEVTRY